MTLSSTAISRRKHWLDEIVQISGRFGQDSTRIAAELRDEIARDGTNALVDHFHLCGTIPEHFGHDSSEEKLYSKYTDALLSAALNHMGLTSVVLTERADAADVEAVAPHYSLVADAKAFRLSRTAKNQKDFKIDAMHGWKRGKPHAMVVCPIYQLPSRASQIYQQAIARSVCIISYSHLSVLLQFSDHKGNDAGQKLLLKIFKCTEGMNPTKDAGFYWAAVNRTLVDFDASISNLWNAEKLVTLESISAAKEEALITLAQEREKMMRLTREQAITSLIKDRNIDGRERVIRAITDNGLLSIA